MNKLVIRFFGAGVIVSVCGVFVLSPAVSAQILQSPNFRIEADTSSTFGSQSSSANYGLTSAGGDTIMGQGLGGSYKLGQGYVEALEKSIQVIVQPVDVVGYYGLDTGTGVVAYDETGGSNDGRLVSSPSWVTGKIGSSLSFSGSNYVNAPDDSQTSTNLSFSGWLNADSFSNGPTAFGRFTGSGSSNGEWMVSQGAGNTITATLRMGATNYVAMASLPSINVWHHISGSYDGTNLRLYVNGAIADTEFVNGGNLPTVSTALTIGSRATGTNGWVGEVDELKVYSKALSDREISDEYAASNAGIASSLTIPQVTFGTSQNNSLSVYTQTDAPDYELGIQQDANLTSGVNTIPAISGTIASPIAWVEGTTKGLGFTLTSGTTSIPGSWGTSPNFNYAAVPGASATFYTRNNYTAGAKDRLDVQFRLDVANTQVAGNYKNTVTVTGTTVP